MKKNVMLLVVIFYSLLNAAAFATSFGACHPLVSSQASNKATLKNIHPAVLNQHHNASAIDAHCSYNDIGGHPSRLACCSGVLGIVQATELSFVSQVLATTYNAAIPSKPASQFLEPIFKPPKNTL